MVLKYGSKGELVKVLQELLNLREVDGIFGKQTRTAVMGFQRSNGLSQDGIVGPMTWKRLNYRPEEEDLDTDRECYQNWIETYHLSENEYIKKETPKNYIMIHHTAGRENPYKVINHWDADNRGRVGTNYVIGGVSADGEESEHDGRVLRAIKDEYFGWHIGAGGSYRMKEQTLSIEICTAGGLKKKDGKWYTWFKEEVHPSQVCILKKKFRGYQAFQKYTNEQLKSLEALLRHLSKKHDISLKAGMQEYMNKGKDAFEWDANIYNGKVEGLISHTNVRKDKSDVFPQPELIELIKRL
jgi:N-acetyl-anhydromuramyl-L-alanine amidase AmpD